MKILKVEKIKVGNLDGVIRVTYRSFFRIKVRDAVRKYAGGNWKFTDNDSFVYNEVPLNILEVSDVKVYEPNRTNNEN